MEDSKVKSNSNPLKLLIFAGVVGFIAEAASHLIADKTGFMMQVLISMCFYYFVVLGEEIQELRNNIKSQNKEVNKK
jgi:hypothetical protein